MNGCWLKEASSALTVTEYASKGSRDPDAGLTFNNLYVKNFPKGGFSEEHLMVSIDSVD